MKLGQTLNYYGKPVTLVDMTNSHCLIKTEAGGTYCVSKNSFFKN